MPATPAIFDFTEVKLPLTGSREPRLGSKGGVIGRPITSMDPKKIRERVRRKKKIAPDEIAALYNGRSIDDWDLEELARGRPRASDGTFKGRPPTYIDLKVHDQVVKRFEEIVKSEMNGHTVEALKVVQRIMEDKQTDHKGRPRTSSGVKLDAAKFLIEHVLGKPKQHTETDISVKLQGILGMAMVNPSVSEGSSYALAQGYIDAESWEDDEASD